MSNNTADEIVNELEMSRDAFPSHSLLLVEGKTDRAFWYDYAPTSRVIPTGNKEKSLRVLEIVEQEGELDGVVAIIDPDCWLAERSEKLKRENLLFDDTPDLEIMLLESPVLEKFLRNEMTGKDPEQIERFSRSLCNQALAFGIQCGAFRMLNHRHCDYNLRLSEVEYSLSDYLNCDTLSFDCELLGRLLAVDSNRVSDVQLIRQAETIIHEFQSSTNLCRGKDVLCIIVHIFPRMFEDDFSDNDLLGKVLSKITADPSEKCYVRLNTEMRKAYELQYLIKTKLYERIRMWEAANGKYKILKHEI